jgi:hypothetical protein
LSSFSIRLPVFELYIGALVTHPPASLTFKWSFRISPLLSTRTIPFVLASEDAKLWFHVLLSHA